MSKALLLVGHGSSLPDNNRVVELHAARIRERGLFDEVQTCFVQGEPSVEGALERVKSDGVYVVPVFISRGVHTSEDIPEALGLDSTERDVTYCDPVGDDDAVTEVILSRAGLRTRLTRRDGLSGGPSR
ncbi:MAG: Sirohydrochlorin cobaltochelatase [Methanonatronarchaeales archaeon]|nr:Sirohydrochlorin cobaltochelatase [Methanonatronarchaeales archaeon]